MQALTPLTIGRSSARASLLGALWGFGHSTGQLILGILLVVRAITTVCYGSFHNRQSLPMKDGTSSALQSAIVNSCVLPCGRC